MMMVINASRSQLEPKRILEELQREERPDPGRHTARIMPTERLRERIRQTARRVVAEHRQPLDILANHEPDEFLRSS